MRVDASISLNFETDVQLKTFVYDMNNSIRIDLCEFIFKLPDLIEMYFINIFIFFYKTHLNSIKLKYPFIKIIILAIKALIAFD